MATTRFYIDGAWVEPVERRRLPVIDPSTEEPFAEIALGSGADVDRAVAAARRAFPGYSASSVEQRLGLLRRVLACYRERRDEIAALISREMGAPIRFACEAQAQMGIAQLEQTIASLEAFAFERWQGTTLIRREPIGVAGLITPWNWPINQLVLKVAPALAAACTMVIKPSELAPLAAMRFVEVLHEAGVPPGVVNLVNGDGPTVGEALAGHPDIDMVSITGSARAGVAVAIAAAPTIKRVSQELGGKTANILLDGVDLPEAVARGVLNCVRNTGQSCTSPSRLLVPAEALAEVEAIARATVASLRVGAPSEPETDLGPLISRAQLDRVQHYIQTGIAEGARLIAGGPGRPEGIERGYYARPTVFSAVRPEMTIAREEIFGPVLAIMPYRDVEDAIAIANATPFGLSANVQGETAAALAVAKQLNAGQVLLNYPPYDTAAPFGGYRQSGNGREQGSFGIEEFLETKAIVGAGR